MQAAQSFWSERAVPAAAVVLLHAGLIYFIGMGLGVIPKPEIFKTPELVSVPPVERPDPEKEVPLRPETVGSSIPFDPRVKEPSIEVEEIVEPRKLPLDVRGGTEVVSEPTLIAPRVRNSFEPPYPAPSIRQKEAGVVYVRVTVTPFGTVSDVALEKSSGSPRLDEAALKGVRQWTFTPGKRGVEAVSASTVVAVRFRLAS